MGLPSEPLPIIEHVLEVFTSTLRISGKLDVYPPRRVLDVLNDPEHQFLPLREATVAALETPNAGTPTSSVSINKEQILLVSPLAEDARILREMKRLTQVHDFVRVQKTPHHVVIATPAFRIEGNIHLIAEVRFKDALDALREEFIAVTDATVIPRVLPGAAVPCSFVAVNKRQISALYAA
jgi:hypothetical protein